VAHQESRETNRLRNRHAIRRLDLANACRLRLLSCTHTAHEDLLVGHRGSTQNY
jgi:hypothetical protein